MKTICTPELTEEICNNITIGLSNKDACALSGITEAAFYKWMKRGQQELDRVSVGNGRKISKKEKPFVFFVESIKKAQPKRKRRLIGKIQIAAETGQWQAAAWILERLHPQEFGKRVIVDWRSEMEKSGINADETLEQFVAIISETLATSGR